MMTEIEKQIEQYAHIIIENVLQEIEDASQDLAAKWMDDDLDAEEQKKAFAEQITELIKQWL